MGAVAFKSLMEEQKTVITALIKEITENFNILGWPSMNLRV